jgi:tRNA wybutosine-synthesizing protein 1
MFLCCSFFFIKSGHVGEVESEEDEDKEEEEVAYEDTSEGENDDDDNNVLSDMGEDNEEVEGATNKIQKQSNGLVDLEDLGKVMNNIKKHRTKATKSSEPKEMITPLLRKSLEKQGYKLIGTHSGVKLCRWTKSMLRGRGGCYKHTFYGIESHRCMETTPSLACGIYIQDIRFSGGI